MPIAGSVTLALLWISFATTHIQAFGHTRDYSLLLFCLSETVVAYFFLTRALPKIVSASSVAWIVATLGTFGPFLFIPTGTSWWNGGMYVVVLGVSLQILSVLSLNKSFGIVAACREVKTDGLYRIVRHPMYASYLIMFAGYLLMYTTVWNIAMCTATIALMLARIHHEELTLCTDEAYVSYKERVRWRLIPHIY